MVRHMVQIVPSTLSASFHDPYYGSSINFVTKKFLCGSFFPGTSLKRRMEKGGLTPFDSFLGLWIFHIGHPQVQRILSLLK